MNHAENTVLIRPKKVVWVLSILIVLLVVASTAGQLTRFLTEHDYVFGLVRMFSVAAESNVPAYIPSTILLISAVLLGVIAFSKRGEKGSYAGHWKALALIFLFLSLDEASQFHELLDAPMSDLLGHPGGFLTYAWVVPGLIAVCIFSGCYLRFLVDLPARTRGLFLLAGSLFVLGALGFEMLGGYHDDRSGYTLTLAFLFTMEETLEMVGILVFIYGLLDYLRAHIPELRLQFR